MKTFARTAFPRLLTASLLVSALLSACGGGGGDVAAPVEPTPVSLTMAKIGGFAHSGGLSSAEITAYDPLSKRLFVINGANASVDVLNLADPAKPTLVGSITTASLGAGLGGINSVAVHCGVEARQEACARAEAPFIAPSAALSLATRACTCRLAKRGSAVAARIDRMMMTTISSINVKPETRRILIM